jgi:hypothetical protein
MKSFVPFLLLALFYSPASAENQPPSSPAELVDIWGSVLYCRAIYEEPNISQRIYDGDRQSCAVAHRALGSHTLNSYPETQARDLFDQAQRKASIIRYNTRSVQEAVAACRELCRPYVD